MQHRNFWQFAFAGIVLALLSATTAHASPSTSVKKASAHHSSHHRRSRRHVAKSHGQQKIDPQRALQIQQALIRQHYLDGEASGVWDDASQRAMEHFQAANGWQTKVVPDSRALIKLGLGPDQGHLLNPESAMTSPPQLSPRNATTESSSGTGQAK
ncbi:MAG: peptidoglycan-binding domain-containing protein [Terriglobales bacterium]